MAVLVQSDNVKKLKALFVPNMMTAAQVRDPAAMLLKTCMSYCRLHIRPFVAVRSDCVVKQKT